MQSLKGNLATVRDNLCISHPAGGLKLSWDVVSSMLKVGCKPEQWSPYTLDPEINSISGRWPP